MNSVEAKIRGRSLHGNQLRIGDFLNSFNFNTADNLPKPYLVFQTDNAHQDFLRRSHQIREPNEVNTPATTLLIFVSLCP